MSRKEFSTRCTKKLLIGLLSVGVSSFGWSQPTENLDITFASPVKIPLLLSGNFGEFRSNHFHTGIDIRTEGRIGIPVYASEEGHISRIRISPSGYGNALYIDHPNGYTTVYGHLSSFKDTLETFSKKWQYQNESFVMNYYPEPGDFKVKINELIGLSGNSGHSGGPHLHYEIRETQSEHPVNPLNFGIKVPDDYPPIIKQMRIYSFDQNGITPSGKSYEVVGGGGNFRLNEKPTVRGPFGIGIDAYDIYNGKSGRCGIYQLILTVNNEVIYEMQIDELDFETVRYINTHMDYQLHKKHKRKFTRCFLSENNLLRIYPSVLNNGIINFQESTLLKCNAKLIDHANNITTLDFELSFEPDGKSLIEIDTENFMDASSDNIFRTENCVVHIPKGRLYSDLNFEFDSVASVENLLSPTFKIGNRLTPLQDEITIKIKLDQYDGDTSKLGLVLINEKGQKIFKNGEYKNGWVIARTKSFGQYAVASDTSPPLIKTKTKYEGQKLIGKINFNLSDNLSGVKTYRCEVDDRWLLLASNSRKSYVYGNLKDLDLHKGEHQMILTVTDYAGNQNFLRVNFIW